MATRLETYDFTKTSNITSTERMAYPWDEWFDGSIWRIEQGVDFMTHPLMMERIIRTRATARHAKLVLRHEPKALVAAGEHTSYDPFGFIVFRRTDVAQPWAPLLNNNTHTPVTRSKRPVRPS